MGASLLQAVVALMSQCTRRLQRAARTMATGAAKGTSSPPRVVLSWKKAFSLGPSARGAGGKEAEGGVWRKEILMGERCQPLDFSGVIYYDAEGRRLAQPPPPRSPMRSPLPASPRLAANARGY
ncbi:uncharacterized protein LOC133931137 [Phragmites australis]|uniref:uncharacterized protein LOC133931137 n=1 Tax=Phragmites australis TaxID=29695 RepID=UPI002D776A2E|nr:uncharacterized protein LOC133931137 [Phragmites australis]